MTDIDYILELFDWNKSEQEQKKGLELASSVKCLNAFLQPGFPYGKRVWKNCAKVVASKNDDILSYFIFDLFDWIEDLNWPGALIILDRLKTFSGKMLLTVFSKFFTLFFVHVVWGFISIMCQNKYFDVDNEKENL